MFDNQADINDSRYLDWWLSLIERNRLVHDWSLLQRWGLYCLSAHQADPVSLHSVHLHAQMELWMSSFRGIHRVSQIDSRLEIAAAISVQSGSPLKQSIPIHQICGRPRCKFGGVASVDSINTFWLAVHWEVKIQINFDWDANYRPEVRIDRSLREELIQQLIIALTL